MKRWTLVKKSIFMINVQSNKLKVSEINFRSKAITRTIALSLKFALIILTHKRFFPIRVEGFVKTMGQL